MFCRQSAGARIHAIAGACIQTLQVLVLSTFGWPLAEYLEYKQINQERKKKLIL